MNFFILITTSFLMGFGGLYVHGVGVGDAMDARGGGLKRQSDIIISAKFTRGSTKGSAEFTEAGHVPFSLLLMIGRKSGF